MKKTIHYYDLDGTLSSLNSTFHFIEGYLRFKRKYLRLYTAKSLMIFLFITRLYHPYNSRNLLLNLYFKGLKKKELEQYFHNHYKDLFLDSLTPLGYDLLSNRNTADVMLTGCTEVPAKLIGELFNFKKVISTEFSYNKGRISGIKCDTYGNYKIRYIRKSEHKMIYFTDDLRSETALLQIMDEIIEVKKPVFHPLPLTTA